MEKESKITRVQTELELDPYEFKKFTDFLEWLKKRKDKRDAGKDTKQFDDFLPKEITPQELEERYKDSGTIGDLKKILKEHNLPNDGKILVQRVEDVYYKEHGWSVMYKEGFHSWQSRETNRKIEAGEYHNKENYPNLTDEIIEKMETSEEDMKFTMEQYTPAWCTVKYKNDDKNLYINLHY